MSNFRSYADRLAAMESNNNPKAVNELHFQGMYQMGAAALMDAGYVRKSRDIRNKQLYSPNVWTGRNGVKSLQDFYNNPRAQYDALKRYTNTNRQVLLNNGTINKNMPASEVYGHLAGSHLLGATQYATDPHAQDKNKKSGKDYFKEMQSIDWMEEDDVTTPVPEENDPYATDEGWEDISTQPSQSTELTPAEQAELQELEAWWSKRRENGQ